MKVLTTSAFVPEQINLLINLDIIFPEEVRSQDVVLFPYITLVVLFIILFLIYYTFIYKTEIIIRLLRIEKYFGETRIENLTIPIQKYIQISIIVVSIVLLIVQLLVFIHTLMKYLGVKESYQEGLISDLISSTIVVLFSSIGIVFNDKLSRNLAK